MASEHVETAWNKVDSAAIENPRWAYYAGWDAAIAAAQEELVRQDAFTERSLRLLDGLYTRE